MTAAAIAPERATGVLGRGALIALMAFLTLVDLFATQAILPSLAVRYGATPAAMGTAVNACTLGMALAALGVALLGGRLDRRRGIASSLALLALPTALLGIAPDLASFAALRVCQGLLMATAFTLTLAHLGERFGAAEAAGAFAAYVTGNVASNLVGRIVAAALADHLGLVANFLGFAVLNLVGAGLALAVIRPVPMVRAPMGMQRMRAAWRAELADPALRAAFGIGFCILFAFIGSFTYVNFVLVRPPFALDPMALGFVYLVFLPAVVTTPLAGRVVARIGIRGAAWGGIGVAMSALPLLLLPALAAVLAGLALLGAGSFLAQAVATGFVGRAARQDRAAASGLYLGAYFAGGLTGSAALGAAFQMGGWPGCVAGIGLALAAAALLVRRLDR